MSLCTKCRKRGAFKDGLCFGCLFPNDKPLTDYTAYEVTRSGVVKHIKKNGQWIS